MSTRKKRKLDNAFVSEECVHDIISEIDLEISLRERLGKALESRIAWAGVLQDTLKTGTSHSSAAFGDAAFDALSLIEAPLDVFLLPATLPSAKVIPTPLRRSVSALPTSKQVTRNPGANFLYINSSELEPQSGENNIYLLRCPQCLRTTFTSLQGLLNHARLAHGAEWGTHDECVRACAVRDPELDTSMGNEVNLGPNGLRPGLRSLFQKAVGGQHFPLPTGSEGNAKSQVQASDSTPSSHLTRTLGLHGDTPSLAPFLGKKAIRRGIQVWHEDGNVDVDGLGTAQLSDGADCLDLNFRAPQPRWRMRYTPRNLSRPFHLETQPKGNLREHEKPPPKKPNEDIETSPPREGLERAGVFGSQDSRFHFTARIIVSDRSLWLPPERRQETAYSYKWMLAVDSPSYSHHITTILQRMTVTPLSGTNMGRVPELVTSKPPFVVVGTADEPFLAKVELRFSGSSRLLENSISQTVFLEHWVELDPLRSSAPVMGDQQVVDIELDKETILLPMLKDYVPVGSKSLWAEPTEISRKQVPEQDGGYERILENLLDKFPLTLKDNKGNRPSPSVPYKLVKTPAQFRKLIPGRRKAIEWGRAYAMREAFIKTLQEQPLSSGLPLSTADIYTWLADKTMPAKQRTRKLEFPKGDLNHLEGERIDNWCSVCGQRTEARGLTGVKPGNIDTLLPHRTKDSTSRRKDPNLGPENVPCCLCDFSSRPVARLPAVNVLPHIIQGNCDDEEVKQPLFDDPPLTVPKYRRADIIAAVDPRLTIAVQKVVLRLKLPTFSSTHELASNKYPLSALGASKSSVEESLTPYAVLAIATKSFSRHLIQGGMEACKTDAARFMGPLTNRSRIATYDQTNFSSVLTPVHILTGIVSRARGGGDDGIRVYSLMARLGVPFGPSDAGNSSPAQQASPSRTPVVSAKLEESR